MNKVQIASEIERIARSIVGGEIQLQKQLSNGCWFDVELENQDRFLKMCEKFNGIDGKGKVVPRFRAERDLTMDDVIKALQQGNTLKYDTDWNSFLRDKNAVGKPIIQSVVDMKKCSCGHTVPAALVMSTSSGTSCPDCYDKMSV